MSLQQDMRLRHEKNENGICGCTGCEIKKSVFDKYFVGY
jgi:hypothetical protein